MLVVPVDPVCAPAAALRRDGRMQVGRVHAADQVAPSEGHHGEHARDNQFGRGAHESGRNRTPPLLWGARFIPALEQPSPTQARSRAGGASRKLDRRELLILDVPREDGAEPLSRDGVHGLGGSVEYGPATEPILIVRGHAHLPPAVLEEELTELAHRW